MRKLLWLMGLFFFPILANSQSASCTNEDFVEKYLDKAYDLREDNPLEALMKIEEGLTQYSKLTLKCLSDLGEAFVIKGIILRNLEAPKKSREAFNKALIIRKQLNDSLGIASIYNNLINLEKSQNNYIAALNNCQSAKAYLVEDTSSWKARSYLGSILINEANIYIELNDLSKAEMKLTEVQNYFKRNLDLPEDNYFTSKFNYGIFLKERKLYELALKSFSDCLVFYTDEKDTFSIALTENAIGLVYNEQNQFEKAEQHLKRSIELFKTTGNNIRLKESLTDLSEVYFGQGALKKALSTIEQVSSNPNMDKVGNIDQLTESTEELYIEYKIELLKEKLIQAKSKQSLFNNFLLGIAALALFITFISIRLTNKAKQEKRIAETAKELAENEIIDHEMKTRVADIFNDYRKQMDLVLHDETCTGIVNVKRQIELYHVTQKEDYLEKAISISNQIYKGSRQLISGDIKSGDEHILPKIYNENHPLKGMAARSDYWLDYIHIILDQAAQLKYFKIKKHIENEEIVKLPVEITKQLTIISNVLLDNIQEHANAKEVSYRLFTEKAGVILILKDDGIGFDPNALVTKPEGKGIGLKNVKNRVEEVLKGKLKIHSQKGIGTTIEIFIPNITI